MLGFALPDGQTHDVKGFGPLFQILGDHNKALLVDKGYDADAIRAEFAAADVETVSPLKAIGTSIAHDRAKYRWRNLVQHVFSKLKN